MAKKKKKQVSYSTLEAKADWALSELRREETRREFNNRCPFCLRGPTIPRKPTKNNPATETDVIQCCFHFISRRRKATRWRWLNVIGACFACNFYERKFPDLSRAWLIKRIGAEKYLEMVADAIPPSVDPPREVLEEYIRIYRMLYLELKKTP